MKPPKKAKPVNGRAKGAQAERELATYLSVRGFPARRGQQFSGGADSPDVVCPALGRFHLECKRVEGSTTTLHKWMSQSIRDGKNKTPLVVHRQSGEDWLVTIRLTDFLDQYLMHGAD